MFEKIKEEPFIKLKKFIDLANDIIKENNYDFKIYDTTYKNMFNKFKNFLNMNNESIIEKYLLTYNGEIFYRKSIYFNKYNKKKGFSIHKIHIWISDSNLQRIKRSKHILYNYYYSLFNKIFKIINLILKLIF